jgi:hypothetical protein
MMVRVTGADGAPNVAVRGPDGKSASTKDYALADGGTIRILRSEATKTTWIGVQGKFAPGTYTITPLADSPAISSLATAEGLPPAKVKASVGGTATRRTLSYDVGARPGQNVTFVEQGPSTNAVIGTVTGGKGTLRFTPGEGKPGTRSIVARISLDGLDREQRIVTRFIVGKPPKAGKPGAVRVARKGAALTVSWDAAAAADRYVVVVTPRGGEEKVVTVSGRRRSARVAGVPPTLGGAVGVHALTVAGDAGPVASGRFAATKTAPSRFLPYSELAGRGKA